MTPRRKVVVSERGNCCQSHSAGTKRVPGMIGSPSGFPGSTGQLAPFTAGVYGRLLGAACTSGRRVSGRFGDKKRRGPGFLVEARTPCSYPYRLEKAGHNLERFRRAIATSARAHPMKPISPESMKRSRTGRMRNVVRSPMCSLDQSATKASDAVVAAPCVSCPARKGRPPATQNMSADGLNQPAV